MAELNFISKDGLYEAEFKAESDFNLHIERATVGTLNFYQKSVENAKYDIINKMQGNSVNLIIDADMTALIYPKWIKIVSVSKPTMAIVTF